jgi:hypothetical protein
MSKAAEVLVRMEQIMKEANGNTMEVFGRVAPKMREVYPMFADCEKGVALYAYVERAIREYNQVAEKFRFQLLAVGIPIRAEIYD